MSSDGRIDVYQLPGIKEVIDSKVREEQRKREAPTSPGRGKGTLAKATIERTGAFRGALCDADWADIAVATFDRMMRPTCKDADFVKLATFLARYNLLSADAQMVIEAEGDKLDSVAIDALKGLIKDSGMMKELPKLG